MARYIDADKFLIDQISRCGCVPLIGSCTMDNEPLKDVLEKQPTADVAEVKHGYWYGIDSDVGWELVACSVCRKEYSLCDGEDKPDYCPRCGAKMDSQL